MSNKIVTVWYDHISEEHGYVIDLQDADGLYLTVNVLDDREEAVEFAKRYAEHRCYFFKDLTDR